MQQHAVSKYCRVACILNLKFCHVNLIKPAQEVAHNASSLMPASLCAIAVKHRQDEPVILIRGCCHNQRLACRVRVIPHCFAESLHTLVELWLALNLDTPSCRALKTPSPRPEICWSRLLVTGPAAACPAPICTQEPCSGMYEASCVGLLVCAMPTPALTGMAMHGGCTCVDV